MNVKKSLELGISEIRIQHIYSNATSDDRNAVSRFTVDCFPESVVPVDWSGLPYHIDTEGESMCDGILAEWRMTVLVDVYGSEGVSQLVTIWFQNSLSTLEMRLNGIENHVRTVINGVRP